MCIMMYKYCGTKSLNVCFVLFRWYNKHLSESQTGNDDRATKVVLLTNDAANREKALSENLHSCSG